MTTQPDPQPVDPAAQVTGSLRRFNPTLDQLSAVVGVPAAAMDPVGGDRFTFTFTTALTPAQADTAWQWITSTDDADQTARNTLRTRIAKVLAETPPTPTRGLLLHLAGLVLGDEYERPT